MPQAPSRYLPHLSPLRHPGLPEGRPVHLPQNEGGLYWHPLPDGHPLDAGLSLPEAQALRLSHRLPMPGRDPVSPHVSGTDGRANLACYRVDQGILQEVSPCQIKICMIILPPLSVFSQEASVGDYAKNKGAGKMLNIGVIGYGYWGPNVARNFHAVTGANPVSYTHLRDHETDSYLV